MKCWLTSWNDFFIVVGFLGVGGAVAYVALQIARCGWPSRSIAWTYVALALIPFALGLFLRGKYAYWIKKRRTVEPSELEVLFSEIDQYGDSISEDPVRTIAKKQAESEKTKLREPDRTVFELDALPLRQSLVDLYYPDAELIGKTRSELEYLELYAYGGEEEVKEGIIARVDKIISELEELSVKGDAQEQDDKKRIELRERLRAELKSLRDTAAWYDRTWAIGEWMRTCVLYWVSVALLVTLLIGILPVVHQGGSWNLSIVHWMALGIAGALLTILLRLHNVDLPELGETEGKQLLAQTIRSIAIGAITATLLYAALWGEALDGKIFPDLLTGESWSQLDSETGVANPAAVNPASLQTDWNLLKNVGLSVFWGILAGLSPNVLRRLTRLALNQA